MKCARGGAPRAPAPHHRRPARRAHHRHQLAHDLRRLAPDLAPFRLAVGLRAARRLLVDLGAAPALARLVLVVGRFESVEHLRLLDRGSVSLCRDRRVDRGGQHPQPVHLAPDQLPLAHERPQAIVVGVVQQRRDLREREAERSQDQDLLQPREVVVGVQPVAGLRSLAGRQQAELVVVVERAHGDARELGDFADGLHAPDRRPSREVRVKARVSASREPSALGRAPARASARPGRRTASDRPWRSAARARGARRA